MDTIITFGVAFAALALFAMRAGTRDSEHPLRRAAAVVIGAGLLVGFFFTATSPVFARDAPRALGAVFSGGMLGAVPSLVYFSLGYAMRRRRAVERTAIWLVSLVVLLPFCLFVGLQSLAYLSCSPGVGVGDCLFG